MAHAVQITEGTAAVGSGWWGVVAYALTGTHSAQQDEQLSNMRPMTTDAQQLRLQSAVDLAVPVRVLTILFSKESMRGRLWLYAPSRAASKHGEIT